MYAIDTIGDASPPAPPSSAPSTAAYVAAGAVGIALGGILAWFFFERQGKVRR